jgi:hypothetical protein
MPRVGSAGMIARSAALVQFKQMGWGFGDLWSAIRRSWPIQHLETKFQLLDVNLAIEVNRRIRTQCWARR